MLDSQPQRKRNGLVGGGFSSWCRHGQVTSELATACLGLLTGGSVQRFHQATAPTCSPWSSSSRLEAERWPSRSTVAFGSLVDLVSLREQQVRLPRSRLLTTWRPPEGAPACRQQRQRQTACWSCANRRPASRSAILATAAIRLPPRLGAVVALRLKRSCQRRYRSARTTGLWLRLPRGRRCSSEAQRSGGRIGHPS